jgi:predicted nucleic acid-binding protein
MNENKIIVDASIVVKWYIGENDSKHALILRDKFINGDIELIVPSLMVFEVLNALKYSKLFNQEELNDVGLSLENYGFTENAVKGKIREKMVEIALNHELTIYDAAYVALALDTRGIMITGDEKIIKKLPKSLLTSVKSLREIGSLLK